MKFVQYKSARLNGKKVWRFDVTIAGLRIRRGEFPTKTEAEQAVAAIRLRVRAAQYGLPIEEPGITLQQLIDARCEDPQYKNKPQVGPTLKRFLQVVSGKIRLKDLSKSDLKKFVTDCEGNGLQARTINTYMATIMATLNAAGEYFPELEDWTPPRTKRLKQSAGRSRVLRRKEIGLLLSALKADREKFERWKSKRVKKEVYDLLRLMLLTAAREGEVLNLRQDAVNWETRSVEITATKTKTKRVVPLSDLAFEILKERKTDRVRFFSLSYYQLQKWLLKISEKAKVTFGRDVSGGWVFYDLRHTAATVMELNGVPYSTVSSILGHKRGDMTANYTHGSTQSMKNAVNILETWCREIDGFVSGFVPIESAQDTRELLAS